jgi:hypothetical protein
VRLIQLVSIRGVVVHLDHSGSSILWLELGCLFLLLDENTTMCEACIVIYSLWRFLIIYTMSGISKLPLVITSKT